MKLVKFEKITNCMNRLFEAGQTSFLPEKALKPFVNMALTCDGGSVKQRFVFHR